MVQWLGLAAITARGPGSILGWGNEIPQTVQHSQEFFFLIFLPIYDKIWDVLLQRKPDFCFF